MAGETRFEHATGGFGDRCSTVEPLPFVAKTILTSDAGTVNRILAEAAARLHVSVRNGIIFCDKKGNRGCMFRQADKR